MVTSGEEERRGRRRKRRTRQRTGMSTMALTCVAGCIALVVSAAESPTTYLLTRGTVPITALESENVCVCVCDMHKG